MKRKQSIQSFSTATATAIATAIATAASLLSILLLTGCSTAASGGSTETTSTPAGQHQQGNRAPTASSDLSLAGSVTASTSEDDYFTDWRSQSYTELDLTAITQAGGAASITKSGTYLLVGTLKDGSVTVNVDKTTDTGTVFLVLNNTSINSSTGTPIDIIEAKKAVIILESGSLNTITQGSIQTTDTEFPTAAIFSKADTAITGEGSLTVTTEYNDGITSKDDLIITNGSITVNAVQDGIVAKDLLTIEKATINVTAGKDGIRTTNDVDADKGNLLITSGSITIAAVDDGIHAEKLLEIAGGDITITTSTEGIEGGGITISNGKLSIVSSDDGMNVNVASGTLTISGGEISLQSGGDGVDANGALTMSGGSLVIDISKIGQADTPIDYDGTGSFTGGTITDQDGNTIDPTQQMGPGGGGMGGGGMGGGMGEKGERPALPPDAQAPDTQAPDTQSALTSAL